MDIGGVVLEGLQAAVESCRFLRIVVQARHDEQPADEEQRDAFRHVPHDAEELDDAPAVDVIERLEVAAPSPRHWVPIGHDGTRRIRTLASLAAGLLEGRHALREKGSLLGLRKQRAL